MRVKSETPDMLVIEDRPILVAILLSAFILIDATVVLALASQGNWAGVAMLGLALPLLVGALVLFVRRTLIFLHRPQGQVTIRVASLIGQTETSLPLANVTGAEVQKSRSSKGGSTYRPALRLAGGGARELVSVYSSGSGADRVAAAINRWLGA
ncbi:hypothetical protein EI545_12860 [Tabrizicola piscis]|uniref:DUF304 domain-containing protein n=1 Tax=Tabrizicola piscis TaxID=2494374 RepID=A0A3S8U7U2_9RHOB|nr:hypothetical protein [Tabrizicola piscis]AZL59643.1 hypothetical protein EI545_12860 [Tabrizicola piscis]